MNTAEFSLGTIETTFKFKKDWVTCNQKNCHCNIEISLPKFKATALEAAQYAELQTLSEQVDMSENSPLKNVSEPDMVRPALEWDRKFKYVMWALGRRCIYSCSYCDDNSHSKTDPFFSRDSLFSTVDRLQAEYAQERVIRYAFTGGEPTLHPDFLDLVKHIHKQGNIVGVTTNGSCNSDYYAELMEYSTINFSVHFQFINLERFYGLIKKIIEKKKSSEEMLKRWIDIRIMIPPGYLQQAEVLIKNLKAIEGFEKMILYSLVPVRIANGTELMNYDSEELSKIQQGML